MHNRHSIRQKNIARSKRRVSVLGGTTNSSGFRVKCSRRPRMGSKGFRKLKSPHVSWIKAENFKSISGNTLEVYLGGGFKSINFANVSGFNGENSEGSFIPNPDEFSPEDKIYEEEGEAKSSTQKNEESMSMSESMNNIIQEKQQKMENKENKNYYLQQQDQRMSNVLRRIEKKYGHSKWNEPSYKVYKEKQRMWHPKSNMLTKKDNNVLSLKKSIQSSMLFESKKRKEYYGDNNSNGKEILLKLMEEEKRKLDRFKINEKELSEYRNISLKKRDSTFRHTFNTHWTMSHTINNHRGEFKVETYFKKKNKGNNNHNAHPSHNCYRASSRGSRIINGFKRKVRASKGLYLRSKGI